MIGFINLCASKYRKKPSIHVKYFGNIVKEISGNASYVRNYIKNY
jgi:hypothetical protein